jgi:hypothetical protein
MKYKLLLQDSKEAGNTVVPDDRYANTLLPIGTEIVMESAYDEEGYYGYVDSYMYVDNGQPEMIICCYEHKHILEMKAERRLTDETIARKVEIVLLRDEVIRLKEAIVGLENTRDTMARAFTEAMSKTNQ